METPRDKEHETGKLAGVQISKWVVKEKAREVFKEQIVPSPAGWVRVEYSQPPRSTSKPSCASSIL